MCGAGGACGQASARRRARQSSGSKSQSSTVLRPSRAAFRIASLHSLRKWFGEHTRHRVRSVHVRPRANVCLELRDDNQHFFRQVVTLATADNPAAWCLGRFCRRVAVALFCLTLPLPLPSRSAPCVLRPSVAMPGLGRVRVRRAERSRSRGPCACDCRSIRCTPSTSARIRAGACRSSKSSTVPCDGLPSFRASGVGASSCAPAPIWQTVRLRWAQCSA